MQRRHKRGEEVASYLRSAEEKAEGRVPSWARFVVERPETIDAKLRMLVFCWMVVDSKGWDALRAPDVASLESLTGFAYMPSTLAKFVSALAISGAAQPLIEAVGRRWHEVAQERWQEPGAMAALYIDNHAKEVWDLSVHTEWKGLPYQPRDALYHDNVRPHGHGDPLVLSVQSGSAPLAPRLVDLVDRAETVFETAVQRAVVIDAEGCTFDLLAAFAKAKRVLITLLKPSRVPELELTYTRGSYYRSYREHDELRIAVISELERLESRAKRDADILSEFAGSAAVLTEDASERAKEAQRAESALATRQRLLDFLLETSPQKKQQLQQEGQQEGRLTATRASLRLALANRQLTPSQDDDTHPEVTCSDDLRPYRTDGRDTNARLFFHLPGDAAPRPPAQPASLQASSCKDVDRWRGSAD